MHKVMIIIYHTVTKLKIYGINVSIKEKGKNSLHFLNDGIYGCYIGYFNCEAFLLPTSPQALPKSYLQTGHLRRLSVMTHKGMKQRPLRT